MGKMSLESYFKGVYVYGMLTVVSEAPSKTNNAGGSRKMVMCRCECGTVKPFHASNVKFGKSKSCGCVSVYKVGKLRKSHGMSKTRIYRIWCGMKDRCHNPNDAAFPSWGGRGIVVCEEWRHDFKKFYDDMSDTYSENLTIDRIDPNGNYEKSNCRWATKAMQANNRRNTPRTNINGESVSLAEFAAEMGVKYHYVYHQAVTLGKGLPGLIEEMQEKLNRFRAY